MTAHHTTYLQKWFYATNKELSYVISLPVTSRNTSIMGSACPRIALFRALVRYHTDLEHGVNQRWCCHQVTQLPCQRSMNLLRNIGTASLTYYSLFHFRGVFHGSKCHKYSLQVFLSPDLQACSTCHHMDFFPGWCRSLAWFVSSWR